MWSVNPKVYTIFPFICKISLLLLQGASTFFTLRSCELELKVSFFFSLGKPTESYLTQGWPSSRITLLLEWPKSHTQSNGSSSSPSEKNRKYVLLTRSCNSFSVNRVIYLKLGVPRKSQMHGHHLMMPHFIYMLTVLYIPYMCVYNFHI